MYIMNTPDSGNAGYNPTLIINIQVLKFRIQGISSAVQFQLCPSNLERIVDLVI